MTAQVVQRGFAVIGVDQTVPTAVVRVEVPGQFGEWCYVVQESNFCWIKGLPEGEGYLIIKLPLSGSEATWQEQINSYLKAEPDESQGTRVPAGSESELAEPHYFLIAQ